MKMKLNNLKLILLLSLGSVFIVVLDRIAISRLAKHERSIASSTMTNSPMDRPSSADSLNTNSGKAEIVHHLSSADSSNKTSEKIKMVQWNGHKWVTLQHYWDGSYSFEKTTLRTSFGSTPMFIHDVKDDVFVSNNLKQSGMWDSSNVNAVVQQLERDPSLGLLDLGAQLGTHTLVASLLGRNVVAVDPLQSNVLRLCKSLEAGRFTNNVTVIFNAISDDYRKISFVLDTGNIGSTRITSSGTKLKDVKSDSADSLYTVLLDDLLPFIPFKKAVMKMDVESHEMHVVRGGAKLFKQMNITAILMEWLFHRNDQALELKSHMINLGFKPFIPHNKSPLVDLNHTLWPDDVMWLK